jgi:hypothetical protein
MKGLATQTIGLILITIIVIGVLFYLFYKYSKPVGFQECSARWFDWCMRCQSGGWNANMKTPAFVSNCSQTLQKYHNLPNIGVFLTDDVDCANTNTKVDCETLMGVD